MDELLRDTVYTGTLLWAAGYLPSMAAYFWTDNYGLYGKIVLLLYLPCAAVAAFWYFSGHRHSLRYYAGVGLAWALIAVLLDIPFVVLRFGAFQYYGPDVYAYYAAMFLIPVVTGVYTGAGNENGAGRAG
jgi:hypothetical protein